MMADGAVAAADDLARLFEADRGPIQATGRRAGSALHIHEAFKARPLVTLTEVLSRSGLSFPAASSAMDELVTMGIAKELTGKKRNPSVRVCALPGDTRCGDVTQIPVASVQWMRPEPCAGPAVNCRMIRAGRSRRVQ